MRFIKALLTAAIASVVGAFPMNVGSEGESATGRQTCSMYLNTGEWFTGNGFLLKNVVPNCVSFAGRKDLDKQVKSIQVWNPQCQCMIYEAADCTGEGKGPFENGRPALSLGMSGWGNRMSSFRCVGKDVGHPYGNDPSPVPEQLE